MLQYCISIYVYNIYIGSTPVYIIIVVIIVINTIPTKITIPITNH